MDLRAVASTTARALRIAFFFRCSTPANPRHALIASGLPRRREHPTARGPGKPAIYTFCHVKEQQRLSRRSTACHTT